MKTKKLLSVLLAALMIFSLTFVAFGSEYVEDVSTLEGYVAVKRADKDTLNDGDYYMTFDDFKIAVYYGIFIPLFSGWDFASGDVTPYEELDDSKRAIVDGFISAYYVDPDFLLYNPTNGNICLTEVNAETGVRSGSVFKAHVTDDAATYGEFSRIIKTYETPTQPDTPAQPGTPTQTDNGGSNDSNDNSAPKLNFFQRIIQWFKDLFAKLFKR